MPASVCSGPAHGASTPSALFASSAPPALSATVTSVHQASAFQLAAAAGRRSLISAAARPSGTPLALYSAAAATAMYADGLRSAAVREGHKYVEGTVVARDRAAAEFRAWVDRMAPSGLTLDNVTPADLLVYMEQIYLVEHTGRRAGPDGALSCSFSAIKGVLGHLKTTFDLLGRNGPWVSSSGAGNPCCSTEISHWRSGYEREQDALGNVAVGARPMTVSKLHALVDALDGDLAALPAEDAMGRLLLLRDITFFLYLFASHQRGGEGGEIALAEIRLQPGPLGDSAAIEASGPPSPLWPFAPDYVALLASAAGVWVRPRRLKNRQVSSLCEPVLLEAAPAGSSAYCVVRRLGAYLSALQAAGQLADSKEDYFLFRLLERHGRGFSLKPFSYNSARARLQSQLRDHGLFEGETLHSFRRGSAQAFTGSDAELQQRMNLNSDAVLALYQSKTRPVRGAPLPSQARRGGLGASAIGPFVHKRGRPPAGGSSASSDAKRGRPCQAPADPSAAAPAPPPLGPRAAAVPEPVATVQ